MRRYKKDVLHILNYQPAVPASGPEKAGYRLVMIKEVTGNIEPDEQFYLYTLKND
ncbi:MAG: hypothetical protein VST71_09725 [Nitrospirota bacterium]|nr:hypothetical protein [Nitrospirota bacterium]